MSSAMLKWTRCVYRGWIQGLTSIPCNASSNLATILLAEESFELIIDKKLRYLRASVHENSGKGAYFDIAACNQSRICVQTRH